MTTFAYTSGDPSHLLAAANASMADIQGPFVDLRTFLNGNISDINLSSSAAITEAKLATGSSGLAKGAFSAFRSTLPATSTGPSVIVFDSEEYDVSGWHDVTTGRFTPLVAGFYRLSAGATFNALSGVSQTLDLYKNGAVAKRLGSDGFASATIGFTLNGTAVVQANGTTDFFDVRWSGSSANAPLAGASVTYFQGELIGRS